MNDLGPVDQALVDHLTPLAWPVGYCAPGDGGGWQGPEGSSPYRPNLQVWPLPADYSGTLASNRTFTDGEWQIRAVAVTPAKVRELLDAARARLYDVPIVMPAGIALVYLRPVTSSGPTVDHTVVPELFYGNEVVEIQTTPTGP